MKIVITSSGDSIDAAFDKRFGRAAYFCIYDEEKKETSFIINSYANSSNGAGTKAAEKIIELKITKAISGDFGPKAKELLDKFNVQMVVLQENDLTVNDIIQKLKNK